MIGIAAAAVALWAISLPIISKWAFSRDTIAKDLGDATSGTVEFSSFRNIYFPHPGCIAEGVIIRRKDSDGAPPLITARRLILLSTLTGIVHKRVSIMKAEGLEVTPGGKGWPENTSTTNVVIEHLVADGALLRVLHDGSGKPIDFKVRHFALEKLGGADAMPFRVELLNPMPPGEISASGKIGPWKKLQREQTAIAGSYSFRHADLSAIEGIAGLLSSQGKFQGTVRQLHVSGETDTPQFEVTSTKHQFPLKAHFEAEVNATNGDVLLQHVDAQLSGTEIVGLGTVVPDSRHRRTATLDFSAQNGHVQDILFPFVHSPRSPVDGVASFRGRVILPSGNEPFLSKINLEADFGIDDARPTNPQTRQKLNEASERARGHPDADNPENVLSDLKGHVTLKNGVATFSKFSFAVPGAFAAMHGTYDVVSQRINLRGTLYLQAKLTDTTSGFKGFLLKAISPFINKKNKPREPLPVEVTGTYDHPQYSVSLTKDNQRRHGM
ncbi:MAG TPA: AsmA-like C-terminal region-containing protein [Terriglobales bacterium]|nr:AsmA-like C-terminal region-containing protein [Terriglobales bacterium]